MLVLESTDKLRWTHINTLTTPEPFGYMWECPDLFCLDGQWYLVVSPQGIDCQNVYGCGWFAIHGDWRGDCTLSEFHELDAGFDYYAPQSFVDGNGRRIQIGWMGMPDADYGNAPTVAYGWQHCFTVPRVLTAGPDGTLLQSPVPELDAQRSAAALHAASGEEVFLSSRFDLTAAPAGDFCLTVAQGVQLVYTEQDCTCTLRFTDPALADGRTVRRAGWQPPAAACGWWATAPRWKSS